MSFYRTKRCEKETKGLSFLSFIQEILCHNQLYYMEESVLLGTKPLVDAIRTSSGTRVAYFPYVTFVSVVSFNDVTNPTFCFC